METKELVDVTPQHLITIMREMAEAQIEAEKQQMDTKDKVIQNIDLRNRQPPTNGGTINVFAYQSYNSGKIFLAALDLLAMVLTKEQPLKIISEIPNENKPEISGIVKYLCSYFLQRNIGWMDAANMIRRAYVEYLFDQFGTAAEVGKIFGMNQASAQNARQRIKAFDKFPE